ncbi:protein EXPORTIN 1B-like [Prunus avium]|uniref:Protein EXPORTIN 1B-like n=1 Tax=Prunus avium TaxID=42229 RepID=A0A6P5T0K9_PRUAV|nr:protein EXPORTIN 1B-like [Prunus avium]
MGPHYKKKVHRVRACLSQIVPLSFRASERVFFSANSEFKSCSACCSLSLSLSLSLSHLETSQLGSNVFSTLIQLKTSKAFIQNLALFLTSFYKSHIRVLETTQQNIATLLMGLEYLINISYVDGTRVFKV